MKGPRKDFGFGLCTLLGCNATPWGLYLTGDGVRVHLVGRSLLRGQVLRTGSACALWELPVVLAEPKLIVQRAGP